MIDERFSAYLDGETSPSETEAILSELGRNPRLRAAWGRQQWLRSMLRDADTSAAYDPGFAERIGRALDAGGSERSRVITLTPRRRWRTAAGLAAAASVVGAVLLVAEPLGGDVDDTASSPVVADAEDTPPTVNPAAAQTTRTAAAETERSEVETVAEIRRPADHWSVSDPAVEDQLNGYLLEHNGLARGYGMSGATPSFLRVATYGQGTNR